MELQDLELGLRLVASAGHVLSCSELLGLQAGLTELKSKQKHKEIFFWGKVFGEDGDYFLAYALRGAGPEAISKAFYYARQDFSFEPLPQLGKAAAEKISSMGKDKVFSGNPQALLEAGCDLKELDRLAQTVQEIDYDAAVVPKGAYSLNEAKDLVPNLAFAGVAAAKAASLECYAHLRPPASEASLRAKAQSDLEYHADFLDTLDGDLPKGCWALRQEQGPQRVTLRSLLWPGYVAYNIPEMRKFGGLYFGHGTKNRDLPFII